MGTMVNVKDLVQELHTSLRTLRRHISAGIFEGVPTVHQKGTIFYELEQAKQAWKEKGALVKKAIPEKPTGSEVLATTVPDGEPDPGEELSKTESGTELLIRDAISINEARRISQVYEARLKKVKYETEKSILVERSKVEAAQFAWAKIASTKMDELPERIVDYAMSEPDRNKIVDYIQTEIDGIKNYLSKVDISI
jgi:hypothetical protein